MYINIICFVGMEQVHYVHLADPYNRHLALRNDRFLLSAIPYPWMMVGPSKENFFYAFLEHDIFNFLHCLG